MRLQVKRLCFHRWMLGLCVVLLMGCQNAPVTKAIHWAIPEDASVRWVNGYPMAYTDRGQGPTVVFVHGVLTDYRAWQKPL